MTSLMITMLVVGQAFLKFIYAGDFALIVDLGKAISVGSMAKDLSDIAPIPLQGLKYPVSVDYDPVEKMMYWTDIKTRSISRARVDGSHQTTVVDGLVYPNRLTLDIGNRMVYWTDPYVGHIARAPMNGTGKIEIIVEDFDKPWEILFDQFLKNIYWTFVGQNATISKSDLDGRNATIIIEGDLNNPVGIAIDYEDGHLYWIDENSPTKLERSDLSGNGRTLVIEVGGLTFPFDLAFYEDYLFWTNKFTDFVHSVYKNGKRGVAQYETKLYESAGGIHIQKEVNYCVNSTCSNGSTCIDVPNGLRCQCQPGFEGITCSVKSVNLIAWLVPLVVVLGLLTAALAVCIIIRKRQRDRQRVTRGGDHDTDRNEGSQLVPRNLHNAEVPNVANINDVPTNRTSFHSEPSFSFPRHLIVITGELGAGHFGRVLLATAIGIEESKQQTIVAIKTLKDGAGIQAKGDLLQELDIMRAVGSHPNIVQLLGCCVREDPIYIIMEHLGKGNLKTYLSECKTQDPVYANSTGYSKLVSQTLVKFARDVASGMSFLSSRKCIHRDLAARNVLISDNMECKVSDFGLSRDITNERIYIRKSKMPLPMRWMALESLVSDVYTTESDVWSFGVLLFELVTLGHRPYPLISVKTMVSKLQNGYRMPRPPSCNEQMYSMMRSCWLPNPAERPTFKSLYEQLDDIFTEEMDYLMLDKLDDIIYDDKVVEEINEIV